MLIERDVVFGGHKTMTCSYVDGVWLFKSIIPLDNGDLCALQFWFILLHILYRNWSN